MKPTDDMSNKDETNNNNNNIMMKVITQMFTPLLLLSVLSVVGDKGWNMNLSRLMNEKHVRQADNRLFTKQLYV